MPKKIWLLVLFVSIIVGFYCPVSLCAQASERREDSSFSADQLIEFAEHLTQQGEYFRAISEYRRFLFYYPYDPRRAMILFRVGLAFYRGQSYAEALETFRAVAQNFPETSYGHLAWLWQGESLLRQQQYNAAEQTYREAQQQGLADEVSQQAHYHQSWALLYRRQWQEASQVLQRIPPDSALHGTAQRLAAEALQGRDIVPKSPVVAGVLSTVLPGSGQLYNGRLGDAVLAFFLNGLFIAGITQAITHEEYAIAGVLGFFEVGWYAGNIYGAVNGAHKENRYAIETFLRNLENRYRLLPMEPR